MTLPRARKITVGGREYDYIVHGRKFGQAGHGSITLTVDLGAGRYLQATFTSKEWNTDPYWLEPGMQSLKHGFTPTDVRTCIEAARGETKLPQGFELPKWK